jgi:membrane protease YdiL (CAAX protease family)
VTVFQRYRRSWPLFLPVPPLLVAALSYGLTRNLVRESWIVLPLAALVVLSLLVVAAGRIKLEDVGFNRDYVGRGLGVVAMIWVASQVIGVLPRVVAEQPVVLDRAFEYGSRLEIGRLFLAAFALAAVEDVALRGFLLAQLYLLFNGDSADGEKGIGWALAITAVVSCLVTLPRTLPYPTMELAAIDLGVVLAGSLLLGWLYLRTRNLFFVIGVHALLVAPTPVVAGPRGGGTWFQPLVVAILATLWALLWPRRD